MSVAIQNKADDTTPLVRNASVLQQELMWFQQVIDIAFKLYFQQDSPYKSIEDVPVPKLIPTAARYAAIVHQFDMKPYERLVLILALVPHIAPQLLDIFFTKNKKYARGFTEFGGVKGVQHGGFLPTGETAVFLLAGTNLVRRFQVTKLFEDNHYFAQQKILYLDRDKKEEPLLSGVLRLTPEFLSLLTTGETYRPTFSMEFPASRLTTKLNWEDLILEREVLEQVQEIEIWIQYAHQILEEWELGRKIKAGYRCLFHGPPGTGKTLTATLLGKSTELEVYRVDLSKVVSKYIGETEKNLANIFDQAENKNWILFFDEADALFGKRTNTSDAKDRYANQEVAYLLQRIEDFPGIVILATNLKANLDTAFARRFQSIIYFPMPKMQQRLQLWQNAFENKQFQLSSNINLKTIAQRYELAGGAVINVLRYCVMNMAARQSREIIMEDLLEGIRRELKKEGKSL